MRSRGASLVLAALLASSCSELVQVDEYTFDVDPCGPPRVGSCTGGREIAFVLRSTSVPEEGPEGQRGGFDLDGTDATICGQRDFDSVAGEHAIDNQMAQIFELYEGVAGVDIREDYERGAVEGTALDLMVLSHVDDLASDDCIEVTRRQGVLPEGVDPSMLDADGDGLVDPFVVIDYLAALDNDASACVIDGQVHARFATRLQALVGGVEAPTERLRLRATPSESGPSPGTIGGSLPVDGLRGLPAEIIEFFRARTDLDPSSRTARDCASLSFALDFEMVPVTLGTRRSP